MYLLKATVIVLTSADADGAALALAAGVADGDAEGAELEPDFGCDEHATNENNKTPDNTP